MLDLHPRFFRERGGSKGSVLAYSHKCQTSRPSSVCLPLAAGGGWSPAMWWMSVTVFVSAYAFPPATTSDSSSPPVSYFWLPQGLLLTSHGPCCLMPLLRWIFTYCILHLPACSLPFYLRIKFLKKEDSVWVRCVSRPCLSRTFGQDLTEAVPSWLGCLRGWCLALGQLAVAWGMSSVLGTSHRLLISWLLKTHEVGDNIDLTWALCSGENSQDYAIPPRFGVASTSRPQKTTLLSHILT